MSVAAVVDLNIALAGDWTVAGVARQHELLTARLQELPAGRDGQGRVTLALDGMESLDACGCQLLAVCLASLRQRGITTVAVNMAPTVADLMKELGFDRLCADTDCGGAP